MNLNDLIEAARKRGAEDGTAAGTWYFDGSTGSREMYQRVLQGITDGDPAVLDTLPGVPDLSGEWADGLTAMKLYVELGVTELQLRNWEGSSELDEILTAYEDAHSEAAQHEVERECHQQLEQGVTFTITVTTEHDPGWLLSELVDLVSKNDCSLQEESFEIVASH